MQNAVIVSEPQWICGMSKSLGGATGPIAIRMQSAFFLSGSGVVYGDEASNDLWTSLGIAWGNMSGATLHLQDGYLYIWEVRTKNFTIKDAGRTTVAARVVDSIADMRIDYDIAMSHQFMIVLGEGDDGDERYPIVAREEKASGAALAIQDTGISMAGSSLLRTGYPIFDLMLADTQRARAARRKFSYRGGSDINTLYAGEWFIDKNVLPEERWKLVTMWVNDTGLREPMHIYFTAKLYELLLLRAKIGKLSQDGSYDLSFCKSAESFYVKKQLSHKKALLADAGKYLMVYAIALNNLVGSKPVFEPWMLWETWRWLGASSSGSGLSERIFDLSPWWE